MDEARRAVPKQVQKSWKMRPRAEDVEVVLRQSIALREDAARCKSTAKVALLVLSLELAGLAWLLALRVLAEESGIADSIRNGSWTPPSRGEVPRVLQLAFIHMLDADDRSIERASKDHPPSLEEVASLLSVLAETFKSSPSAPQLGAREAILSPRDRGRVIATRIPGVWPRLLTRFQQTSMENLKLPVKRLDLVKNAGLYVRVDSDGAAVPPQMDRDDIRRLRSATTSASVFVRKLIQYRGLILPGADRPPTPGA